MSDDQGFQPPDQRVPSGSDEPMQEAPGVPPEVYVPPAVTVPPGTATSDLPVTAPAKPRRRPMAYAAVVIGLLGLVGGGVFFARSVKTSSSSGAKTPQAAVQKVFDALANQDGVGVLEALAPGERAAFGSRLQTMASELARLGVLRSGVDLSDVGGVDLEFNGLRFTTETLSARFAHVTVVGGRVSYRVDQSKVPIGDFVRGLIPKGEFNQVITGSADVPAGVDAPSFTTVKVGSDWYVSLWYSVAESARRDSNLPLPTFGSGIPAVGADSPDVAVEQFLRAAAALDVRKLIELTPLDEAGALHDYAPLFIKDAENAAAGARHSFTFRIDSLTTSARPSGDEAVVKVTKMAFKLSVPGIGLSITSDGRCATIKGNPFGGDIPGAPPFPKKLCGDQVTPGALFPGFRARPEVGFVAVRRDGKWFVSPTRTLLDALIAIFKSLNRSDLETFKQMIGDFTQGMSESGSGSFVIPTPGA